VNRLQDADVVIIRVATIRVNMTVQEIWTVTQITATGITIDLMDAGPRHTKRSTKTETHSWVLALVALLVTQSSLASGPQQACS
jgi:hypothetical protein